MTRFEASIPGTSGMTGMRYFGFVGPVGVSRRLVKVLPVKELSLDGLIVPRNASRSLDHPNRYRGESTNPDSALKISVISGQPGALNRTYVPGFRNHVRAGAMYPGDGLSPDQSRFCDSWEVPGIEA